MDLLCSWGINIINTDWTRNYQAVKSANMKVKISDIYWEGRATVGGHVGKGREGSLGGDTSAS